MLTIFHWKIVRAHLTPWDICAERMTILAKLFASLQTLRLPQRCEARAYLMPSAHSISAAIEALEPDSE